MGRRIMELEFFMEDGSDVDVEPMSIKVRLTQKPTLGDGELIKQDMELLLVEF